MHAQEHEFWRRGPAPEVQASTSDFKECGDVQP